MFRPTMEFYCDPSIENVLPEPKPASKHIPDWFKKIPAFDSGSRDDFGGLTMTAKKCMPMLDAMSLGYVIPLQGDLGIMSNDDCSIIKVKNPPGLHLCEFHDLNQVGGKKAPGAPAKPLKFINHWVIKTAPGWSTLIMPLINDIQAPLFTCLSGLVDTDKYPKCINFPAIWHACNYDGILSAGTPLVVAIPIKRDSISRKPNIRKMTQREFNQIKTLDKRQQSRRHVYTNELRDIRK